MFRGKPCLTLALDSLGKPGHHEIYLLHDGGDALIKRPSNIPEPAGERVVWDDPKSDFVRHQDNPCGHGGHASFQTSNARIDVSVGKQEV